MVDDGRGLVVRQGRGEWGVGSGVVRTESKRSQTKRNVNLPHWLPTKKKPSSKKRPKQKPKQLASPCPYPTSRCHATCPATRRVKGQKKERKKEVPAEEEERQIT